MMQPITLAASSSFDYSCVKSDVVPGLRLRAEAIRARITKTTCDIIETGRELALAKVYLEHGQFAAWVEAEISIPARTAQAYMSAAKLADERGATVAYLPPATVYRLAAKSAPAEVIDAVMTRASSGAIIPDRAVADMIAEVKHQRREAAQMEKLSPKGKAARTLQLTKWKQRQHEVEQESRRQQQAVKQAAIAMLDRFDAESVVFIIETFDKAEDAGGVLAELRRLAALT